MKLVVEIEYWLDKEHGGCKPCVSSSRLQTSQDEDYVRDDINQADIVARLVEISHEVKAAVEGYGSKETGLIPMVLKKSSIEPRTV